MSLLANIGLDLGACHFRALSQKGRRHQEAGRMELALKSARILDRGNARSALGQIESLALSPVKYPGAAPPDLWSAIIEGLLEHVLEPKSLWRPHVFIALRESLREPLQQKLQEATLRAGAARVSILPSSQIAGEAIGYAPSGLFLGMDIGGPRSDLVLRDKDEILAAQSIPIAGDHFDAAIRRGIDQELQLIVSEQSLFKLKSQALLQRNAPDRLLLITGRNSRHAISDRASIEAIALERWLGPEFDRLTEYVVRFLHDLSVHHSFFLRHEGLWIYGGGARMRGLDSALAARLAMPVHIAHDPSRVLMRGLGRFLSKK